MKNKNILYGLLGVGALAGFYFWNKKTIKSRNLNSESLKNNSKSVFTTEEPKQPELILPTKPIVSQLNTNKNIYPQKINNVKQTFIKTTGIYDKAIIPKGTVIEDVRINYLPHQTIGFFNVDKLNDFDGGGGEAKNNEFDILEVTDISYRKKVDKVLAPFAVDYIGTKNGFKIGTGDIVKIKLNQDVERWIPNQIIFYTAV
jgi:hypothetical protein